MPFQNLTDLPDSVGNHLPKHTQEIYRAAFDPADEQSRTHRVGWSAVEENSGNGRKPGSGRERSRAGTRRPGARTQMTKRHSFSKHR